jgi:hypothetical protein
MRHDLSGDQLEMINVIKVDHLQVGALGASLGEGRQPVGCQNSIGLWNAAVLRSPAADRYLLCWGPMNCTQASVSSGFSRLGHSPPAPPIE